MFAGSVTGRSISSFRGRRIWGGITTRASCCWRMRRSPIMRSGSAGGHSSGTGWEVDASGFPLKTYSLIAAARLLNTCPTQTILQVCGENRLPIALGDDSSVAAAPQPWPIAEMNRPRNRLTVPSRIC